MNKICVGPSLILGDNVDTDQIFPGRYLALVDPQAIGQHCLEGIALGISDGFPPGGIIIAGKNFGCGSSREHAAIALQEMGVGVIIAESFARIFYRNAINLGIPLVVCTQIQGKITDHEEVQINLFSGEIKTAHHTWYGEQLSKIALDLLEAGGIKSLMKQRIEEQ